MSEANPANPVQMEERIKQVSDWLLDGESRHYIVQSGSEMWSISERQVDKYIRVAKKRISEIIQLKNDLSFRVAWHIRKRQRLLKTAISDHELNTALNILDSLAKLEGLLDPALQEKLRAETEFYKNLASFPIETALKILSNE